MLLSIDGTFLIQILNLIVFWVLLNYVFIAPTQRAIEKRLHYIAEQRREADDLKARARELQVQADTILTEARRATDEAMRTAASRASDESHAIERRSADEAAANISHAHATVSAERAQAVEKQGPFVDELARTMADHALRVERVA